MEYYENEPSEISHSVDLDPFQSFSGIEMRIEVTNAKTLRTTLNYAIKQLGPGKAIVLVAQGREVSKAVSCVEIMKANLRKIIYQNTRICKMKTIEVWTPILEGLDPIRVTCTVPMIHILLSLEPLDDSVLGYQKHIPRKINKQVILESEFSGPPSPKSERKIMLSSPRNT